MHFFPYSSFLHFLRFLILSITLCFHYMDMQIEKPSSFFTLLALQNSALWLETAFPLSICHFVCTHSCNMKLLYSSSFTIFALRKLWFRLVFGFQFTCLHPLLFLFYFYVITRQTNRNYQKIALIPHFDRITWAIG